MATHNSAAIGVGGAATLGSGMAMNIKGWAAILHITCADATAINDAWDYHEGAHLALTGSIVGQAITTTNPVPTGIGADPTVATQSSMVLTLASGKTCSFSGTLQQIQMGRNNIEGTLTYNFVSYGAVTFA